MTMLDQHIEGVPNVYTTDDLKVDCCVLTQNSRYVVTGSANGPPQVWDMQVRLMPSILLVICGHTYSTLLMSCFCLF